jgi:hypothetical protein
MGLDITAYRNLKVVENPLLDEDGYPENWETEWKPGASMEWSEECFKGRGEGIDANAVYTYEEDYEFGAGSYSGYNSWRDILESFSNGKDFYELINFADNEGVIGYVIAKKLYNDFLQNEERAKEFAKTISDGEWWIRKYEDWKTAFEYASDNGAVNFH